MSEVKNPSLEAGEVENPSPKAGEVEKPSPKARKKPRQKVNYGKHKPPDATVEFRFSTEEELRNKPAVPQLIGLKEIVDSPTARSVIGEAILAGRKAIRMRPVTSNEEFLKRIDDYFEMAQGRSLPPTVEEMSLYCGYTSATFRDWAAGRRKGFDDEPEPGMTTAAIAKKAIEMMHNVDAVMAETVMKNPAAYIFRSKNYYGMADRQEITITPAENSTAPLSADEIAKRLPDPDADYDVD